MSSTYPNITYIRDYDVFTFIDGDIKKLFKKENINKFASACFPKSSTINVLKRPDYVLFITHSGPYSLVSDHDYMLINKRHEIYLAFSVNHKLFKDDVNEDGTKYSNYIEDCNIIEKSSLNEFAEYEYYYKILDESKIKVFEILLESVHIHENGPYQDIINNIKQSLNLLINSTSDMKDSINNEKKIQESENNNQKLKDLKNDNNSKTNNNQKKNNLMEEKIKELENNNQKLKDLENENNLMKKKLKELENNNNMLNTQVEQLTLKNQTINCDKSISNIINMNLWNINNLNINVTSISTNKTSEDITTFLNEYRQDQLPILYKLSNKFKKFTNLYKAIKGISLTEKKEIKDLINGWLTYYLDPQYTDFHMHHSEAYTVIFNYMYHFGYLVIPNCDNCTIFTFITLSKHNKDYAIYYSDYVTNNTDIDINENSNIKEQIINNKNNIIISINEKNITYFKIL